MNNKIIIIAGDPNSINSEIIFKTWKKINPNKKKKIILIGCYRLIKDQLNKLGIKVNLKKIKNINEHCEKKFLKIIDYSLNYKDCFNVQKKEASKYVKGCLSLAHKLSEKKIIKGFINCPVDKKLIVKKGIYGVTELIAKKSNIKNYSEVMMLYNKKLSVVPITTHIKIKEVFKKIKKTLIIQKLNTLNQYYKRLFKKSPRIAVLGLNPHNSEFSKDSEEYKEIIPAIKFLKKKINVSGPMSPDSFFLNEYKTYDVIVGMYHDQVLIPFKNIYKYNAINITLGLKYIRVSPDHGTATNIMKKNKANFISLTQCINFMNNLQK